MTRPLLTCLLGLTATASLFAQAPGDEAIPAGAVVLYTFDEGEGAVVTDRVGAESGDDSLDLSLGDAVGREGAEPKQGLLGPIYPPGGPGGAEWVERGLRLRGPRVAAVTPEAATRLTEALRAAGEWTVEVVLETADLAQEGPARIVSLSVDPYHRNFTLGQERDHYIVRVRTTETEENGMPDIATPEGAVRTERQHVAATFGQGLVSIYVDGELAAAEPRGGDLTAWDPGYALVLANEADLDRQWNGTFEYVAVYDRALPAEQVRERFESFFPPRGDAAEP